MLSMTKSSDKQMDVLFYEVEMFNRTLPASRDSSDDVATNAFLESFLLHLRNLLYFLELLKLDKDDLSISDFHDNSGNTIIVFCAITPTELEEVRVAINKHLSHMTKTRFKEKPSWKAEKLLIAINDSLNQFISKAADSDFVRTRVTREEFELSLPHGAL